ncbi:MAG TPA: SNF2-related protein [Phnomibacter sp.]|nr:SNF2-related protein [Phnomibacter sp.]
MSLPFFVKHIYNNASEEVIKRGKRIHAAGHMDLLDHNTILETIAFRVKDDMYHTWYKVKIDNYNQPKQLALRCTCPYNLTEVCRHKAAALLQLQEMSDQGMLGGQAHKYNQAHTLIKIRHIDLKMIRMFTGNENYDAAEEILRTHSINITSAANEKVTAELVLEGTRFPLVIRKNDERYFDTSCNCDDQGHILCKHKTALFLQLLNAFGANYFDSIRNYDRDKEKLLGAYGYTLDDDLRGKFEFAYKEGKPFLRVLDPSIKKVNIPLATATLYPSAPVVKEPEEKSLIPAVQRDFKKLGMVFRSDDLNYPFFCVDAIQGMADDNGGFVGKSEKIDLGKFVDTEVFSEEDKQLFQQLRKLTDSEINKYLNRNSPFSGIWDNIVQTNGTDLPEETKVLIHEYLHPKLMKIWDEYHANPCFLLPDGKKYITANLESAILEEETIKPVIMVSAKENAFAVSCVVKAGTEQWPLEKNEWASILVVLKEGSLYCWQRPEDISVALTFERPLTIPQDDWAEFAEKKLIPLTTEYEVVFDKSITRQVKDQEPEISVQLVEKGEFLAFVPNFKYGNVLAPANEHPTLTAVHEGSVTVIHRMIEKERQFFAKLNNLHTNFIRPERSRQLVLKGADVLRNNWFFLFMESMQQMEVPVLGFDYLRNFKFNAARPTTQVRISSGVDWFDAKVDVHFGDQHVRIADIKKALAHKQSFVHLQDGSLGILPEEWLHKYSLLFKVGEGSGSNLRLSRYQFGVIDELYDQRDDEELQVELEEKFDRLRDFKKIKKVAAPDHLQPILRPYQLSGFQWLNFLKDTECGGILADDMGLGKTLQALTMLEHYENKTGDLKALVVCPTTLLYNWESEIKKFTPNMEYFIHHGGQRSRSKADLEPHHIIITTYGTLRSDILLLKEMAFDFVVLDESQAIKNPNSKVARAACLLQSKHRVCMSGTPLQNNTYDIYAQMNFLNPGLLGSSEFFRNEFATPIDKFGEQEQKEHLRKLIYPFILRRTKEQVAKDLPEKTETILYCEMGEEQRKIYDAYRNDFRDRVLGAIDAQGMERSQLTILQGLMKLRQICDSPAILNEDEKFPNHSIKLDELAREITENISDHKALVFSQFLGMLALIRAKLNEQGVQYEYFDGSTSVQERQRAIENFQNNPECRVFLISLKAGGVGLNLTAADYVYIVDPWWNPAVEQQAIDRTHRIGQTRSIFAYRMICKDSVEDKIIQLQDKKRILAKELIADDAGFVKKLTRDDIAYLFS